jgi:poly(3-hydroxybutyrate) depolymerase
VAARDQPALDTAFEAFWSARSVPDAMKAAADLAARVPFDASYERLKQGRTYSAAVPRGIVRGSHRLHGSEFFYAFDVPESYDPAKRYQVRFQLHGGVGRESNRPRGDGSIGPLAGVEQIYVTPYAWNQAPWWSDEQIENLRLLLDVVKRTYNVDENRVAVAGVSDGGTGAFYLAMRDPTPYASFLPLNGNVMVLRSIEPPPDLFLNNLRNRPFFAVNGALDPLYPTSRVGPVIEHLKQNGVSLEYHPQANGVHNTAWWPDVKDTFEAFVRDHPRRPFPDVLSWEWDGQAIANRIDWLIVEKLRRPNPQDAPEDDRINLATPVGPRLFEHDHRSGRVDLIREGNVVRAKTRGVAEFTLLLSPEAFDFGRPVRVEVNGRVAHDGPVERNAATLLKWAARDNDRTALYGAELRIQVN